MKKRGREAGEGERAAEGQLEGVLGHRFTQPELLTRALTHRSFVYEGGAKDGAVGGAGGDPADPAKDNEQLEFVGDAVLGLLAAEALCRHFPGSREGELTRLRASVVSRKHLGEMGMRLGLGRWLRLGRTAERNDGRKNPALSANVMEAVIAAIYLDGGLEPARRFVETEILGPVLPLLERSLADGEPFRGAMGDHKSALQEMLQAGGLGTPEYRLVSETGPDHKRLFRVEVRLDGGGAGTDGPAISEAEGPTKKQAQQEAARLALAKLGAKTGSKPATGANGDGREQA